MVRSLHKFEGEAHVWVLCLNDECYALMAGLAEPNVRLIRMEEFESANPALVAAKANRSLIEYYFTCTPSLVSFVMKQCAPGSTITYVDADLYFFSDPRPLHEELDSGAVSICPHRFPPWLKDRERYGLYNVGWLTFRNDARGEAVADWWRDRCIEWCFDVVEQERFADQKYLDRFPELFEGVVILQHHGANVAPWNLGRYEIGRRGATVTIEENVPLIFFHFHGVKHLGRFFYRAAHRAYGAPFRGAVRRDLYLPYVAELASISRQLHSHGHRAAQLLKRHTKGQKLSVEKLKDQVWNILDTAAAAFRGEVVCVVGRAVF